jgi:PAS domain S-box-containing protein
MANKPARQGKPVRRDKTPRERAKAMLRATRTDVSAMGEEDVLALVHELQVHQAELETQNEELRRVQAELAESRDRYSILYDFAPAGYITVNADGRILEANFTAAAMLGIERRALRQRNFGYFVDREAQHTWHLHRRAAMAAENQQSCELAIRKADGTPLVMRLESIALGSEPDRRCHIALIDITEHKRADEALRESEEHARQQHAELELIYQNAPVGLCVLDRALRYVRINDRLAIINGTPAPMHIGRSVREVLPGLADTLEPICRSVMERGESIIGIELHGGTPREPDMERDWLASYFPVRSGDGSIVGVGCVVEDITGANNAKAKFNGRQRNREQATKNCRGSTAPPSAVSYA